MSSHYQVLFTAGSAGGLQPTLLGLSAGAEITPNDSPDQAILVYPALPCEGI